MFGSSTQEALGKCPKCEGDVVKGKYGVYGKNKCGMNISRVMGAVLAMMLLRRKIEKNEEQEI